MNETIERFSIIELTLLIIWLWSLRTVFGDDYINEFSITLLMISTFSLCFPDPTNVIITESKYDTYFFRASL